VKTFWRVSPPSWSNLRGTGRGPGTSSPTPTFSFPAVSEVRPFLVAMKWSGAKVVQPKYQASLYLIRSASSHRIEDPTNAWST
jgi:hypothetical protein